MKNRLTYLKTVFLSYLETQSLLRLTLLLFSWQSASLIPSDLLRTFAAGIVYDAAAGIFFCLPLAIWLLICPDKWINRKQGRISIVLLTFAIDFFMVFTMAALFLFWQEFHTNFNFIAVDYLVYTQEMLGTIRESFNMPLILLLIAALAFILTQWQKRHLPEFFPAKEKRLLLPYVLILFLLPAAVIKLTDDGWRNAVSQNYYNIEIAGNGPYCFVSAFFSNELDYARFYREEDQSAVNNRLRRLLAADNSIFIEKGMTTAENTAQNKNISAAEKGTAATSFSGDITRRVFNRNALTARKPNIILITVESLSSNYVGAFGAEKSYTPNLDKLAPEAYIFTRMYATGTRTVRGLEALSLAIPPTPGQSVLRRPGCENLSSLGNVLNRSGYKSDFLYGGYGYFDNMNEFFGTNGYQVKDRMNIPKEEIFQETIWGVADEILYSQVLKSMDGHYANREPAFEMVMTTSNHRPFLFPEGRVHAQPGGREGAVRYTDWAIRDFLKKAESRPWFNNTIFVIIADHQASVAGKTDLPVGKYHIPCIIYAPGLIRPGVCDRLISQMDLAPTLLGMLGISYSSRFLGRDIAQIPKGEERIFISTYQSLGYIEGNTLVVLKPGKQVDSYRIEDWNKSKYIKIDNDPALVDKAITWYQGANYLFKSGLLKNPDLP